jgi:RNase adaptor protein for sRNA GlmZ degradation
MIRSASTGAPGRGCPLSFASFAYKHGVPRDADFRVPDARSLRIRTGT